MASQALYRKWRSQSFDDIIGQPHVTQTLQNALAANRTGHAYLFTGPRGTGKTSTARVLAKAVNCVGEGTKPCNACSICRAITEGRLMDLIEIDAASNTSVDDIRDLRDKVGFRPSEARIKFYIIDEVHMLSKSAFNALLKTLEEPPEHVIFVLATTEPEKIPATIISRCQRFDFRRIRIEDIVQRLQFILAEETIHVDEDALIFIARQAGGSMRDAISLLDQLTAYGHDAITLELVHSVLGTVNSTAVKTLIDHLLTANITAGLSLINQIVGGGADPKQFTLDTLEYLRGLLLIKYGDAGHFLSISAEDLQSMQTQAAQASALQLLQSTQRFNQAIKDFKTTVGEATIPHLPLELAYIEAGLFFNQPQVMAIPSTPTVSIPYRVSQPDPMPIKPMVAVSAVEASPVSTASASGLESGQSLSKDDLRSRWPQVLEAVGVQNQQYLKKPIVQDVDIQGNTILITFAHQYRDAATRVDKNKEKIITAFQTVLGKRWLVEFKTASVSTSLPSPAQSPSIADDDEAIIQTARKLGGQVK